MSILAKMEAQTKAAQIQGHITRAVQAAGQLNTACAAVSSLRQDCEAAYSDDADTLAEIKADIAARSAAGWADAKGSVVAALDVLANGVGITRNDLLDSLKTAE